MRLEDWHIVPCVGCGYCCQVARCCLSLYTFETRDRTCPALVFEEGRFWCRLVKDANEALRPLMVRDLCIGAGCSSSLCNSQREALLQGKIEEYLQMQQQRLR